MSVISIPSRKQVKASAIAAASAALLAAVLLAGIGVWHLVQDDTVSRAPSLPASRAGAIDAESAVVPPVTQDGRPATVYLIVGSAEQADAERARLAALNASAGPLEAVIVVAESDAAAANVRQGVEQLTPLREAEGLPPLQLIDLRPTSAGRAAGGSGTVTAPAGASDTPSFTP